MPTTLRLLPLRWLRPFAFLFLPVLALAHDPLGISVDGRVDADTMVVRVALFPTVAACLAGLAPTPNLDHELAFTRADFTRLEMDFVRITPTLIRLKTGDTLHQPVSASVAFTDSEEIQFVYTYASPPDGRHRLETTWLEKLPDSGYRAFFELRGRGFRALRPALLTRAEPAIEFTLGPASGDAR